MGVKRPSDDRVEAIVEHLVERVLAAPVSVNDLELDGEANEVVLDLNVGGIRCLLTRATPRQERPHVILSLRAQEISRMVAKGYANKMIAAVLDISSWTVSTYLRRVSTPLAFGSRGPTSRRGDRPQAQPAR